MEKKKQFFYGWGIVGASVIILAIGLGMFFSTNSIFVKPVCDSLSFSRSEFTFHRTIITLAGALILPLFGKLIDKIGVKKTLLIGSIALSIITFAYSYANSLRHFYILAFFNGLFSHSLNFIVIGILISSWFDDKKGLATGIAYSGSGLGGAVMIPIVSRVVEVADWRVGYRFMGIVGLAILVPVILIFIKDTPAKLGLLPYKKPQTDDEVNNSTQVPINLTLGESLKTGRFWLLVIAFFFISVFAAATNTHSAPFLSDVGYSASMVSAVISVFMIFLTVGKILLGAIYDRYDTLVGNLTIIICSVTFPIAALLLPKPVLPWIYAVTLGIASCGISVPLPILITRYFGDKDYPTILSALTMVTTFGPSISVPAMGAVFDSTGSYRPAWYAILAFSAIIAICLVGSELSYKNLAKKYSHHSPSQ